MNDHVYAVNEVVGSSGKSIEDAIGNAIATASETLRQLEWFQVTETRGQIIDGQVAHYQVSLKIGVRYDNCSRPPLSGPGGILVDIRALL